MNDLHARGMVILGLVLALVTGLLLYGTVSATARVGDTHDRVDVVVARVPIAANAPITADALDRRAYPSELAPSGSVSDPGSLVGQRLTIAVPPGAPVLRGFVSGSAVQTSSAFAPSQGQVLVSFPTTDPLTSAGFVQVGDRVDLLATVTTGDRRVTQKTLQNLEVLAVAGGTRDQPGRALVFIVDHQTSLVLKYLRDSGAVIDVVLRSRDDTGAVNTRAVDLLYLTQNFGVTR
ncbi:MAG TPA: Flp pilus assembly protein CpaB [Candidatus Limnocylindria bacterium]|nr:Flp pilus assembly protein CpaB [Candidatus Limnocylindria bacterium]